jgi:hypothetical protein
VAVSQGESDDGMTFCVGAAQGVPA